MEDKFHQHEAHHLVNRIGWMRAAVLGANDGILSIASILSGVTAGGISHNGVLLAGFAGLVAGATSMATGEYVSVSSQADTESADIERERRELSRNPRFELEELAHIYQDRGLDSALAHEVAKQLMAHDALGAHTRDELGITNTTKPRPLQAALTSAASFTAGAALPLLIAAVASPDVMPWAVKATSLACLALLGAVGAHAGGVRILRPTLRVLFWGILSLSLASLVGSLFHVPS